MLWEQKRLTSNRLSKNHKGATLIEVIAVIAVLSVVAAAVAGFMISGAKMSAKVSGVAAGSMKEQTTVEFINEMLWRYDSSSLEWREELKDENSQDDKEYLGLVIKLDKSGTVYALVTTENNTVVYRTWTKENGNWVPSDRSVELCPGKIVFEDTASDTVTYYINNEKHVVHLRVAPQS